MHEKRSTEYIRMYKSIELRSSFLPYLYPYSAVWKLSSPKQYLSRSHIAHNLLLRITYNSTQNFFPEQTLKSKHHFSIHCPRRMRKVDRFVNFWTMRFNPLTAKLFNLNFHSLEIVSRSRDPQLQVSENYSDLTKWR